jgi:hypothetical protein
VGSTLSDPYLGRSNSFLFDQKQEVIMCWYSADHAESISEAEAGQRLGIRKVHGSRWVVGESDLHELRPTPVCLMDRTRVLFRFSELEQVTLRRPPEAEAIFRMLTRPKCDVFQFSDGRDIAVNSLQENLASMSWKCLVKKNSRPY